MANEGLLDKNGVIAKAVKMLSKEDANLYKDLVEALSELEDGEAHRTRTFPKTRLHKVSGIKNVYRAYIDKISGWRIHLLYGEDNIIELCDVLDGNEHDQVQDLIKRRRKRYT